NDRTAFIAIVQSAIRVSDGAFAGLAFAPHFLAGLELHAGELTAAFAVQETIDQHEAAVMVLHGLVEILLLGLDLLSIADQLDRSAADAVGRRGENLAVAVQRRRAVGGAVVRMIVAPQERAVAGQSHHAAADELNVLPLA